MGDGQKSRKIQEVTKKRTGRVLSKLILGLTDKLPEIQLEKAGKRFSKMMKKQAVAA